MCIYQFFFTWENLTNTCERTRKINKCSEVASRKAEIMHRSGGLFLASKIYLLITKGVCCYISKRSQQRQPKQLQLLLANCSKSKKL